VTVAVVGSIPSAWAAEPNVAFGTKHALALRNNGDVLTWGDNVMCQLWARDRRATRMLFIWP